MTARAACDVQISASQHCVGATITSRMLRITRSVATEWVMPHRL